MLSMIQSIEMYDTRDISRVEPALSGSAAGEEQRIDIGQAPAGKDRDRGKNSHAEYVQICS